MSYLFCNIYIKKIIFVYIIDDQKSESTEKTLSYVQDPCANVKTGFGYSVSSKHKNGGSINFVKGETINVHDNHNSNKHNVFKKHEKDTINNCDIKKCNASLIILN